MIKEISILDLIEERYQCSYRQEQKKHLLRVQLKANFSIVFNYYLIPKAKKKDPDFEIFSVPCRRWREKRIRISPQWIPWCRCCFLNEV